LTANRSNELYRMNRPKHATDDEEQISLGIGIVGWKRGLKGGYVRLDCVMLPISV
jgi:hypothetical protein